MTTPDRSPDPAGQAVGAVATPPGRPFAIAGFILALLSLAMMPPAGIVGVVCGAIGWSRGDRTWGIAAIVASVVGFVGGFVIAAFVLTEVVGSA